MSSLIISNNNNRKAWRDQKIQAGFTWNGNVFQSDTVSQGLIGNRVTKINTLILEGRISLTDTSYIDEEGQVRYFFWWDINNNDHLFTAQEFLKFAVKLEEWVGDLYVKAKISVA